jgi:DNA repair protein RAD5
MANIWNSATSLGMMNDEEKKMQRIEDIKELLS